MNNITKQWITLGLAMGVSNEDLIGVFPNKGAIKQVTPTPPQPVITITPVEHVELTPVEPMRSVKTSEEAQRLYGQHRNWATVARLMNLKKAEVIALVHSADTKAEGLTIKEATRIALNSKAYRTMKELVSVVREQNLKRPAYENVVRRAVWQMIKGGQAKTRKEIGQLTGYKLVG